MFVTFKDVDAIRFKQHDMYTYKDQVNEASSLPVLKSYGTVHIMLVSARVVEGINHNDMEQYCPRMAQSI